MLLKIGAAVLAIAFLVKSAMWPLGFWLPTTYAAASPPVAAMLVLMTKVGVYVDPAPVAAGVLRRGRRRRRLRLRRAALGRHGDHRLRRRRHAGQRDAGTHGGLRARSSPPAPCWR